MHTRLLHLAILASIVAPSPALAQSARPFTQVALSPDGARIAWIGPAARGTERGDLFVGAANAASSASALALPGADAGSASELAWSRDGKSLAILAVEHGEPAIYVSTNGAAAHRVFTAAGSVHDLAWSPDGAHIAVLYSTASEEANSPVAATPRDTGVMDSHIDRQHLGVVDVASGTMKPLSAPDLYIYEFDWSPDGRHIAVSQAKGSGNNNWWVAKLSSIDVGTGTIRDIAAPKTQLAEARWSPDGSEIAYIGGLMSDQGVTGGDLYVVPSAGGAPRDVTPAITSSVSSFNWTGPHTVLATGYAQGQSQIADVDVSTARYAPLWSGDEHISTGASSGVAGGSVSANGATLAVVRESFSAPPEIWLGAPGKWAQVTHANDGLTPVSGKAVSVRWKSEQFNVQGFLIYPKNFDPAKKYPMIVTVHGGPSSAVRPSFLSDASYEAAESQAGYFVFLPNPRGSYGQGEAFTRANVKDFGHGDLKDIMSGVDAVLAKYPVDGNRLGIRGWSYGGFMTMWAVTQTHRFKAAVSGAGLSNWLSYTGENGISEWMVPFFGATAYENKAVYDKSSPINYIDNAKTPTLIVVGERDAECPAPQSFEFWRGLQHAGVTTQLVVYPDEGHHFVNPQHVRDVRDRTIHWMDEYLKGPRA